MTFKVSVYRFDRWDIETDEHIRAPRFATMEAIRRVQGDPVLESNRQVDRGEIDGDGFYPKRNVWLVEIFDMVSRLEGRSRVSVPHGEYLMFERSTESYWLTNDELTPVGFELTLLEVLTYLQGKMRIVVGTWP